MDDITAQLNQILSDPQSMQQIQGIMSGLGLGGNSPNSVPENNPVKTPEPIPAQSPLPNFGTDSDMINMITKIGPLLSQIKDDDNSTRLLNALRPMLSVEKQEKIDQSMRILQLMKLFPLLKDSGMFTSILGGLI